MAPPFRPGRALRPFVLPALVLAAFLAGLPPGQPQAKTPPQATLVADDVTLQGEDKLAARGHVEVFYQGTHVTASAVLYDAAHDRLTIEGPIRIEDGQGMLILADGAELSADLTEGLIRTARLVIDQRLQLAAADLRRQDGGRVTAMRGVAASSCRVCGNGPPLWEIRAREVVHDAAAQQIWFSDATLRFAGLPVVWLPMLRVPDPSLKRATGFLFPKMRASTALGTSIALPYFITLGPSRDLTLTPALSDQGGTTLGWRYRQAFTHGAAEVSGAFSRDALVPEKMRGYLKAKAHFGLGASWVLDFDATVVSDPSYLQDYDISDDDRLTSELRLTRVEADRFTSFGLTGARTLRSTESNATQPSALVDGETVLRFAPQGLGGVATLQAAYAGQNRTATSGADEDADGIADGRDMGRLSLGASWAQSWFGQGGLVVEAGAQAGADLYTIAQDDIYEGRAARELARGGLRLRLPLMRKDAGGTTLIEPALQLVSAGAHASGPIPNEDSRLVEFDEANLFAFDRYPGADAIETGTWASLGTTYERVVPSGQSLRLTLGRILRLDPSDFSEASGLGGARSDWLVAGQLDLGPGSFTGRALADDTLQLSRFEGRFDLNTAKAGLGGGYEFVSADATEGRDTDVRELYLEGSATLADAWTFAASDRYDLSTKTTRASLGITFKNECLSVDLSVSRRFASSSIVTASSNIGLQVEFLGLGGASDGAATTTCRR